MALVKRAFHILCHSLCSVSVHRRLYTMPYHHICNIRILLSRGIPYTVIFHFRLHTNRSYSWCLGVYLCYFGRFRLLVIILKMVFFLLTFSFLVQYHLFSTVYHHLVYDTTFDIDPVQNVLNGREPVVDKEYLRTSVNSKT